MTLHTLRNVSRRTTIGLIAASLAILSAGAAGAASCPTVADPQNLAGAFPQQVEIEEAAKAGVSLAFTENPLFADDVKSGKLKPVGERLPEQPLIVLPYDECGKYGARSRARRAGSPPALRIS